MNTASYGLNGGLESAGLNEDLNKNKIRSQFLIRNE